MKKLLMQLFAIVVWACIASCSKSSSGPASNSSDYFIRFKANGTQLEYKAHAEASFNKQSGANYITTFGGTKDPFVADKSNMTVALTTVGVNAINQTYTNYAATGGATKAKLLQLAFYDANNKFFMSWSDDFIALLPAGTPTNARLVITEATSVYIKGNFSGTMLTQDYLSKLDITDGEFYLKLR